MNGAQFLTITPLFRYSACLVAKSASASTIIIVLFTSICASP